MEVLNELVSKEKKIPFGNLVPTKIEFPQVAPNSTFGQKRLKELTVRFDPKLKKNKGLHEPPRVFHTE
jgi:hypothetical protein